MNASMFSKIASLFKNSASAFKNLEFFHTSLPFLQATFWDVNGSNHDIPSNNSLTSEDNDKSHLPNYGITLMPLAMQNHQGISYQRMAL